MKEIDEIHESGDIARKREVILKKLSQVDIAYRNIKKYLGIDEGSGGDLQKQLEAAEKKNEELTCQFREHESLMNSLRRDVQCEKDYNESLCRMQTNLEETRCNLQHDVLNKTAEIERITIQMKNLQCQIGEHLSEMENLHSCIEQTSSRNECEKEAIKKALKVQCEKSCRCDEGLQKATAKVKLLEDEASKCKQHLKQLETELERLRPEAESKKELEEICKKLQDSLKELQPLPELLKSTELKLKEEQTKNMHNETRVTEQARLISEISAKIDGHQENVRKLTEEISCLNSKKMELSSQVKNYTCLHEQGQHTIADLNCTLQAKNEIINQLNCKLEDKDCSNLNINRQLEKALAESNRISRIIEDRALEAEKQTQGQMKDLEAQLQCNKQEIKQLKGEKQDLECKYGRQMQDLRDKLEQCDKATHNMQSYISYLKTAYASVFNDPNLSSKCPPLSEANNADKI